MNVEQAKAIGRELAEKRDAATPGEWWMHMGTMPEHLDNPTCDYVEVLCGDWDARICACDEPAPGEPREQWAANAELIAHCRTSEAPEAIAFLAGEVERLKVALAEERRFIADLQYATGCRTFDDGVKREIVDLCVRQAAHLADALAACRAASDVFATYPSVPGTKRQRQQDEAEKLCRAVLARNEGKTDAE
jgi:hypothetical protein